MRQIEEDSIVRIEHRSHNSSIFLCCGLCNFSLDLKLFYYFELILLSIPYKSNKLIKFELSDKNVCDSNRFLWILMLSSRFNQFQWYCLLFALTNTILLNHFFVVLYHRESMFDANWNMKWMQIRMRYIKHLINRLFVWELIRADLKLV